MKQYCRYCNNLVTGNGTYCTAKNKEIRDSTAKSVNHCKQFEFNEMDAFFETDGYKPRSPKRSKSKEMIFEQIEMGVKIMEITKIFCDHCGKVVDESYDYKDLSIEVNHKVHNGDLCKDCFEKLNLEIGKFFSSQKTIEANECIKGNSYLNAIYSRDVKINGSKNN